MACQVSNSGSWEPLVILAACKSRYDTLKEGSLQDRKFLRDDLYNTFINSEAPSSDECESCGDECIQFYRCTDCANWEVICQGCLLQRHQQPHLHVFEAFWVIYWKLQNQFLTQKEIHIF